MNEGWDCGGYRENEQVKPTEAMQADLERRQRAVALIQSWRDGDDEETEEQCDTWAFLRRAMEDNKLSGRRRV